VLEVADAVIGAIGKTGSAFVSRRMACQRHALYRRWRRTTPTWRNSSTPAAWCISPVDHSSQGAPPVPDAMKATFRKLFKRSLILSGGYDARAPKATGRGQMRPHCGGPPFLANPDLVARWSSGAGVNAPDMATFYTPDPGVTPITRRWEIAGAQRAVAHAAGC